MEAAIDKQKSANSWWFDRHNDDTTPKRSLWLNATLEELDETTRAMLNIIEEDADSFAQRAEMYYKRRPELIGMVEHVYRSHRSLAVRYDQLKYDAGSRISTPLSSPFSILRSRPDQKLASNLSMTYSEKSYDSYSETTYDPEETAESEVDDPEEEEAAVGEIAGREEEEVVWEGGEGCKEEDEMVWEGGEGSKEKEIRKLKEEIKRLEAEKKSMKGEVEQKDEAKREVIRQLSMALDMVKEENTKLRKLAAVAASPNPNDKEKGKGKGKESRPVVELKRLKDTFLGKLLFNGFPRTHTRSMISLPL